MPSGLTLFERQLFLVPGFPLFVTYASTCLNRATFKRETSEMERHHSLLAYVLLTAL